MKKLVMNSPIPLYYQLREIIRSKIVSEEWEYGAEIPSELKLCEEFNVSRSTVKQALDGLVNEGLIVRKRGKGTFVVYKKSASSFLVEPSLLNIKGNLVNDYTKLLFSDIVEADSLIKKRLHTNKVCQVDRVHYIDKTPIALDSHYIKGEWVNKILEQDLENIAIYKWIEVTFGVEFDRHKINIQTVMLNKYENEIFNFPPLRLGLMTESVSFINNEPILFNKRIYRGDRCDLNIDLVVSNQRLEVKNSGVDFSRSYTE